MLLADNLAKMIFRGVISMLKFLGLTTLAILLSVSNVYAISQKSPVPLPSDEVLQIECARSSWCEPKEVDSSGLVSQTCCELVYCGFGIGGVTCGTDYEVSDW